MIKKGTYDIIIGVIGFIVSVTLPAMILYWVGRIAYNEIAANMINFLFLSPLTMLSPQCWCKFQLIVSLVV